MNPAITLYDLQKANFKTSRHADELSAQLSRKLGLKNHYEPARLAIARSLAVPEPPSELSAAHREDDGRVIRGNILFGDDLAIWSALLVEHAGKAPTSSRDLIEQVRLHWHRGIELLMAEWAATEENENRFVMQLAERAGLRAAGGLPGRGGGGNGGLGVELRAAPIELMLGEKSVNAQTQEPVRWLMNGRGYAPHVALMGRTGSGKTRTGMNMIRQVREQTGCPVILFDMVKGDLASDDALARSLGASVVRPPRMAIPLDVLSIPSQSPEDATSGAMRFRDSFRAVSQSKLGALQLDRLRDALRDTLVAKKPARLTDVRDQYKQLGAADKRRGQDSVGATLNDLTSFELFTPELTPAQFFSRSWILDLHDTSSELERRLIVFLILDALCNYQRSLPDAPTDKEGHRAVRLVIGIDEARKFLGYEHGSLIDLVRESRSKGFSIFFMSQSPDDYEGEDENFLENIGLALSFVTAATKLRALKTFLGEPMDLGSLGEGVAATRLPGKAASRVKCW